MPSRKRKYTYWIAAFILLFFILPDIVNFRERRSFSDNLRMQEAKERSGRADSVTIVPGEYYRRGQFYAFFFGEKNRAFWTTPVNAKVLHLDTMNGGLVPYESGGSQQTISIRLKDTAGRHWVLRSVNKDQQNVLPWMLRHSALRSLFRDQVASINPYGPMITAVLAEALHLPHAYPRLYWMPYNEAYGKYNERMAGRLAYLEEHFDSTWRNSSELGEPKEILDTDDMLERLQEQDVAVDTLLYLETRLFDMLVNDWDRHADQWRWALVRKNGQMIYTPIAKDRDMAFYIFDEGIVSSTVLVFNPKFQSFRKTFGNIRGLVWQSRKLDRKLLKGVPRETFPAVARVIQASLTPAVIHRAFSEYPPGIYIQAGRQHEEVLQHRLNQLPSVALEFHRLVNR